MITFFLLTLPIVSSYPIIIVPGIGGSVLKNIQNDERIWPPTYKWLFYREDWEKLMKIDYNVSTGQVIYNELIQSAPIGNKESIRVVNRITEWLTGSPFYNRFIDSFPQDKVFALPYDFRLIGFDFYLNKFFKKTKIFLEQREKSDVICHSLGGLVFHLFLTTYVSKEWKDKHINKLIFINVPFGGSFKGIESLLLDRVTFPFFKNKKMNYLGIYSGFLWCLPNELLYLDRPILNAYDREYNCMNFIELVANKDKINYILDKYIRSKRSDVFESPGTSCYIIYCSGVNTINKIYKKERELEYEFCDGDGTVTNESLLVPQKWNETALFIKLEGDHCSVLSNKKFIKLINSILNDEVYLT